MGAEVRESIRILVVSCVLAALISFGVVERVSATSFSPGAAPASSGGAPLCVLTITPNQNVTVTNDGNFHAILFSVGRALHGDNSFSAYASYKFALGPRVTPSSDRG